MNDFLNKYFIHRCKTLKNNIDTYDNNILQEIYCYLLEIYNVFNIYLDTKIFYIILYY